MNALGYFDFIRTIRKLILISLLLSMGFSSNVVAFETRAQQVEREKRQAIEQHRNDRTVHGKVRSGLPSARQKGDALLEKWRYEDEWNKRAQRNRQEYLDNQRRKNQAIAAHALQKQASSRFTKLSKSCQKGSSYNACQCENTIGKLRVNCFNKNTGLCKELKRNYSKIGSWSDIKNSCVQDVLQEASYSEEVSIRTSYFKCIDGDTSACLAIPKKIETAEFPATTVSKDRAIMAMQYACYRSSQYCDATTAIEKKFGVPFSSEKRHLLIEKRVFSDKCKAKPTIESCLKAGKLTKSYEGESEKTNTLFRQACDLVAIKSRSTHAACNELVAIDSENCSNNLLIPFKEAKKSCTNVFDIMKNPIIIKKAKFNLVKNCIDRNRPAGFREDVCSRAIERTSHPLAIVELCSIHEKSNSIEKGKSCQAMQALVEQSDDVAQMRCVASLSNGKSRQVDKAACEKELEKALKNNTPARFFYTLTNSSKNKVNVGLRHIMYANVAFSMARAASTIAEREFWRTIGCKKSYAEDYCKNNNSHTYRFLIERGSKLDKCMGRENDEKKYKEYARKKHCLNALVNTYKNGSLANFINFAVAHDDLRALRAVAAKRAAEIMTNNKDKFIWYLRSCRAKPSTIICNNAAIHARKANLPVSILKKAPPVKYDGMMALYNKTAIENEPLQQSKLKIPELLVSSDYFDIRFPNNDNYANKKSHSYTYKNGDNYDGEWDKGYPSGKGIYTFENGDIYFGQFKAGIITGKGIYRNASRASIYEGGFKSSKRHGHGIVTMKNGNKYEGNWIDGIVDGTFRVTSAEFRSFEKVFKNGKFVKKIIKKMEGIGIAFKPDETLKKLIVSALGDKMPAQMAGLRIGDILIAANDISFLGKSIRAITNIIKGPAGSTVKLEIERKGKTIVILIKRGRVDFEALKRKLKQV